MRLLFRKVIWAAVKAVLARELWGQPIRQSPQSPLCKFLNPKLENPLLSRFISLDFLPTCCPPLLDQQAVEVLSSPSWGIFQARREPSLARLHIQDWHGWIVAGGSQGRPQAAHISKELGSSFWGSPSLSGTQWALTLC